MLFVDFVLCSSVLEGSCLFFSFSWDGVLDLLGFGYLVLLNWGLM
jgi:hypothetical protein